MVTWVFTGPELGSRLEITGAGMVTVKETPALDFPPAVVTTTDPVVAPSGTFTWILALSQLLSGFTGAFVPLKVTVPGDVPKFDPLILTLVPTGPKAGFSFSMTGLEGALVTVKVTPALD